MGLQIAQKEDVMTIEEIHKLIEEISTKLNALAEQQLSLATTVNQLSEALLEVARNQESREASNRLLEGYLQHSMNYRKYAATKGRWTLDPLATEEAQDLMTAATAEGRSAVAAIAKLVVRESRRRGEEITDATTKFVGLVVSFLMESNGYAQTGRVGPIHCNPFTKGRIYQLIDEN
jgi:maltooligosyltrehalose synthase